MQWNPGNDKLTLQIQRLYQCSGHVMRSVILCFLLLCTLVLQGAAYAQDVGVRAELSASTITSDDSVVLNITAIGIDAELDASSLERDFDVVGRSSSRQIRTVIGANNRAVNTSVVTWSLELSPRGEGVFTVPAVRVGDYETQLLSLSVNPVPSGANRDLFIEMEVDTTTPWVQSQVLMTVRIYEGVRIMGGGLDSPAADDLVVERLGEDEVRMVTKDGREYKLTERRFAMFPQKSGPLSIDPITLTVTVPKDPGRVRSLFAPTRKLTRRSEAVQLEVQARPLAGTGWWLPAANVWLRSEWEGDPQAAQVDQPLTRTLVMRAEGVLASQLPEINLPAIDGISVYAEEPQRAMGGAASGLVTEQRINWALIPQRSGTMTLPVVSFEWFNTRTGKTETVELPEETITVEAASSNAQNSQLPAAPDASATATAANTGIGDETLAALSDSASSPAPAPDASDDLLTGTSDDLGISGLPLVARTAIASVMSDSVKRWQLIALATLALWMMTLVAWFFMHRRALAAGADTNVYTKAKRAKKTARRKDSLYQEIVPMKQVDKACKQGNLSAIKQALLEWAERQWPDHTINTLDGLQRKLSSGVARDKLAVLQTALYSKQGLSPASPTVAEKMADLPSHLRAALQQDHAAANSNAVSSRKGRSRLPSL